MYCDVGLLRVPCRDSSAPKGIVQQIRRAAESYSTHHRQQRLQKVRYEAQDALWGGISRFSDALPAGTKVGFWASDITYLLYGKRFQHSLFYLPLDAQPNSDEMFRYLHRQPVDVIAVGPRTKYNDSSPVWIWTEEKRRHFEKLHGEDPRRDVPVYRLKRSGELRDPGPGN